MDTNIHHIVRFCVRYRIVFAVAAFFLIVAGIVLRFSHYRTILENNLATYYFDKFNRLVIGGHLPVKDVWEFAPGAHPENVPPGLAYVSMVIYTLLHFFLPRLDTAGFANVFPLLVYGISSFFFIAILLKKAKSSGPALLMSAVLAFSSAYIALTSWANYTEEVLGVAFLVVAIYVFSQLEYELSTAELGVGLASVFGLLLTWQQFPLFYLGVTISIAAALLLKQYRVAVRGTLFVTLPFLGAELVARALVKTDYSVIGMTREYLAGLVLAQRQTPDFITAMVRADWRHVPWSELVHIYEPLTMFLFALGVFYGTMFFPRWHARTAAIFGVLGLGLVSLFEKEKSLALGLMLVAVWQGACFLFSLTAQREFIARTRFFIRYFYASRLIYVVTVAVGLLVLGWALRPRLPEPEIKIMEATRHGREFSVTVRLTNLGGTPFYPTGIFRGLSSGVHIELENAIIDKFWTEYPRTGLEEWPYYVYPYARLGNVYFVETKFRALQNKQFGDVKLTGRVEDERRPLVLYYRGWMPVDECIRAYTKAIEKGKKVFGWEHCVIRQPADDNAAQTLCPIHVFSGRKVLQDFRCFKQEIN